MPRRLEPALRGAGWAVAAVLAAALAASCATVSAPRVAREVVDHGADPVTYVTGKIAAHRVVFLGEMHQQKQTLDFIAASMAAFHRAGMRTFASEFLRSRNTGRADALVNAPAFDRPAAVALFRDFAWIWAFGEYVDILEAVWAVNRCVAPAERIRVVGLDFEWKDWPGARVEFEGDRDQYMADRLAEALADGKKAVVHLGSTHALKTALPDGAFTASLTAARGLGPQASLVFHHASISGDPQASNQEPRLAALMDEALRLGDGRPFGVDVGRGPLAGYRDRVCWYFRGNALTLGRLYDGYVVLCALDQIRPARYVDGFIDATNLEKARAVAADRGWFPVGPDDDADSLNRKYRTLFGGD